MKDCTLSVIERISEWAASAPRSHSAGAVENARQVIEDAVACIVAGAGDLAAANVRTAIRGWGPGRCAVVGDSFRSSAPFAALANGTAAHALDYDDTFLPGVNHASAVMVPALLSLSDEERVTGAQLIDAYIVGLEAMLALARGVMRSHYDIGWHTTSTLGCMGAAVAAARLLRCDARQIAHTMSLATSMSGGMKVQFGTMAKPLHAGLAAQHAVQAARLAQAGVEGHMSALEGRMGFLALCGGTMAVGWQDVQGGIGAQPLAIEVRGLMVKRFPCCASTHRVLDCILELREETGFEATDVEAVRTFIGFGNSQNLMYANPVTELQARFSMQYCVAVALATGTVLLTDFTPEAIRREKVRALMPRVSVTAYEASDELKSTDAMKPHRVEITLRDGRVLARERDLPKGTLKYPFDARDRDRKFADCCAPFLPAEQFARLRRTLAHLHEVADASLVTADLACEVMPDTGSRFALAPTSR